MGKPFGRTKSIADPRETNRSTVGRMLRGCCSNDGNVGQMTEKTERSLSMRAVVVEIEIGVERVVVEIASPLS